jgi:hypothetical protein
MPHPPIGGSIHPKVLPNASTTVAMRPAYSDPWKPSPIRPDYPTRRKPMMGMVSMYAIFTG